MTGMWTGDDSNPIVYDNCFSTWYLPHDLTTSIISVNSTIPYSFGSRTSNAVNGYYCAWNEMCFGSSISDYPWWSADLGESRSVSNIIVITRHDVNHPSSFFSNVVVTLGDNSDYTNNPTFGTYPQTAPVAGTVVNFTPPAPLSGRFLKFQSMKTGTFLVICEVRIN